jgi:hypothetical protein
MDGVRRLLQADHLRQYVTHKIDGPPQLVIPWSLVHNLNVLTFAVRRISAAPTRG